MLTGAAVCPHPPILVPETTGGDAGGTGRGARELGRLRAACDEAVAGLVRLRPDVLVIVGGAERSGDHPVSAPGCLSRFGVWAGTPDGVTRAALGGGDGSGTVLPLSLTIGRWLVDRAGRGPADLRLLAIAEAAPVAECLAAGARIAARAPRVALLVMGEGPARRVQGVPGAADPEADRYDAEIAAAFAGADARALAALDARRSAGLLVSGRAPWQVLAGAAEGGFRGQVTYTGAPFEVSYLVATWHREP